MKHEALDRIGPCTVYNFHDITKAKAWVKMHQQELIAFAKQHQKNGKQVRDQDYPVSLHISRPINPVAPPVVLLGGMGPEAGAQAFGMALERFGNTRQVILLQLCTIVDRTLALKQDASLGHPSAMHQKIVNQLSAGLHAIDRFLDRSLVGTPSLILTCNTAHAFIDEALDQTQSTTGAFHLISLIKGVTQELAGTRIPVLLLRTTGMRLSGMYTKALRQLGIPFVEPSPKQQELLMEGIYQGVKGCNNRITVNVGKKFFADLLHHPRSRNIDTLAALCTEIPALINAVIASEKTTFTKKLASIRIVDPIALALATAEQRSI